MDMIDIFSRAVGLFYVFAGYAALRAILMDAFLDRALSALGSAGEDPAEAARRRVLGTFSVLVGASGAALALMSFWALPLFAFNTAAQAAWIARARRLFIAPADDDEQSRRQVGNAAFVYAIATAGVGWLWWSGRLGPWDDPVAAGGIVAAAAGFAGWFLYRSRWKPRPLAGFADAGAFDDPHADGTGPGRVLIDPAFGCWPLVDADGHSRFSHWRWLPEGLAARIEEWDDVFQLSFDPEDVLAPNVFPTPQAEADYHAEAEAIAAELRAVYGPGNVAFGPGWTDGGDLPEAPPA